jgi:CubicO group peptidase (beta-lactamase class C family)
MFHLASVTKTLTAVLVLQLVAEGRLSLDQRAADVLPSLAAADAAAGAAGGPVTIGGLLSHTSGIDADYFRDTGPGDDALEMFAARAAGISRPFAAGQVFSYGNAGYSLLGRIAEVVTGSRWDRQLQQRILGPLTMTRTTTSPELALRWPFAVGHERGAAGRLRVATGWPVPRSMGPAGVLCATAADLLRFGAAVAEAAAGAGTGAGAGNGSRGRAGRQRPLLPAELAGLMRQPAASRAYSAPADSWGLGWGLEHWGLEQRELEHGGSAAVLSHDGGARGYESFLRVLPDHSTAVVLLVNGGGDAAPLVPEVFGPLLRELCGVTVPPPWAPPAATPPDSNAAGVTGSYACGTWRLRITSDAGQLRGELRARGLAAREMGRAPVGLRLRPAGPGCYAVSAGSGGAHSADPADTTSPVRSPDSERPANLDAPGDCWPLHAVTLPDGTRLVHMWSRAAPAVQE